MKTSRERTILITVLGVAGLGLLADRVIIGSDVTGPAQSSAGVVDGFDADPSQQAAPSATELLNAIVRGPQDTVSSPSQGPSLAERLRLVTSPSADTNPTQTRNAFTPAPGWATLPSDSSEVTDNQARLAAEAFRSSHVLDAVFVSGNIRYAVIAGQTLSVGQELDGYRLVEVQERTAVFQARGVRVEVVIKSDYQSS